MDIPYNDRRIAGDFLMTAGQYGPKSTGPKIVLDYIECSSTTVVNALEEMINGISTNVITEHNMTPGSIPGAGYVIKSKYGHGFSKIIISGAGNAKGYELNSGLRSNYKDSPNSGILSAG